jgi:predicted O-methyltransferase YrrM
MIGNALIHFIKFTFGFEQPFSQTTKSEQLAIAKYAKGAKNAVEIGVFEGVNTVIIGKALARNGILYAIDPFFKGKLGLCYHEIISKLYINKNKLTSKVNFIPKLSFDVINDIPEFVDFIFVDGDHSLGGIQKDWELFSTKVSQGGIIALHDTAIPKHDLSIAELGSFQYFNGYIKHDTRFKLIETIDSLNILQKL